MWHWIKSLDRILRGEATRPDDLRKGTIDVPLGGLSMVILLLGMIYGVCMAFYAVLTRWGTPNVKHGLFQVVSSAVKVPALLFLTLLVTFPSLYVFNALVGSRLSFGALVRLLIATIGVMTALLASFGTIVVFFSLSTESYSFMVLLNVLLFAVSGFLALGFLLQTLHRLAVVTLALKPPPVPPIEAVVVEPTEGAAPAASDMGGWPPPEYTPPPGPIDRLSGQQDVRSVRNVFRIWVIVFGLVGAQMGWVLRPFVLHPKSDFVVFRQRESNFFTAVFDKLADLFDPEWGNSSRRRSSSRSDSRPAPVERSSQPSSYSAEGGAN